MTEKGEDDGGDYQAFGMTLEYCTAVWHCERWSFIEKQRGVHGAGFIADHRIVPVSPLGESLPLSVYRLYKDHICNLLHSHLSVANRE
jgi:hypothetical protein